MEAIMKCYLCGSVRHKQRAGSVRDDTTLSVLECEACGLVFLSSVEHIQQDHYEQSGMHGNVVPDVEMWLNESKRDDLRRADFLRGSLADTMLLDFGCGAGGFLECASVMAKEVCGVEPEERLHESFMQRGLTVYKSLEEVKLNHTQYDLITAFHVIEHLPDPATVLKQMAESLTPDGAIIIEVPSSNDALLMLYKSEPFSRFTYWSQHLYLFNPSTLAQLAAAADLKVNWIKQVQRYPLSNHLFWLAKGEPGGHKRWSFLDSPELSSAYETQLAAAGLCDTLMMSLRLE